MKPRSLSHTTACALLFGLLVATAPLLLSALFPAGGSQPSSDPRAEYMNSARKFYGFDAWPGKGGKLRPGVNAARVLAPSGLRLQGPWVHGPVRDLQERVALGTVEFSWSNRARPEVQLRMWVAPSCNDAHDVLIRTLADRQIGLVPEKRGDGPPLRLGDVSFVRPAGVKFVRNNVAVVVYHLGRNATQVAQAIDKALRAEPERASLDALRPKIRRLALAPGLAEPFDVEKTPRVPFLVDAVDPRGGKLFFRWDCDGPVGNVREEHPGRFAFQPDIWAWKMKETGIEEGKIILTAISTETGLFSTAELRVKVAVKKRPPPPKRASPDG